MRVIAGTARRTPLSAPQGLVTRPTADRAKEALFSILGARVAGAHFLDLFCGSGAVGIEALSRGASRVVFVDNANAAIQAVKKNITAARFLAGWEMIKSPVISALAALDKPFDIIFLDPPYESTLIEETLQALGGASLLSGDGLIVAETQVKMEPPNVPPFECRQTRDYGRTRFLFYGMGGLL